MDPETTDSLFFIVQFKLAMKNKSLRWDARAAQRKVPAKLARSPAARTPDGVLDLQEYGRRAENEND